VTNSSGSIREAHVTTVHALRYVARWTFTLRGGFPWCLACQVDLTVEHVLLHCVSFTNARDNFFCVTLTSISELFSKVVSRSIIDFIKDAGFYRKI